MARPNTKHAQEWKEGDGFWYKQAGVKHQELIKRNSTASISNGHVIVRDKAHTVMLDRGLYLPRD